MEGLGGMIAVIASGGSALGAGLMYMVLWQSNQRKAKASATLAEAGVDSAQIKNAADLVHYYKEALGDVVHEFNVKIGRLKDYHQSEIDELIKRVTKQDDNIKTLHDQHEACESRQMVLLAVMRDQGIQIPDFTSPPK